MNAAPESATSIAAVVLAAGKGTRMKSTHPKVLHKVGRRPLIRHVLDYLRPLDADPVVVVVGPEMDAVRAAVAPHPTVEQKARLGTADAVKAARGTLSEHRGDVLIVYGDTPFIASETLSAMVELRHEGGLGAVVLGFRPLDPTGYGRLLLDEDGKLGAIVEDRDATDDQRAVDLCNSGVMCVDGAILFDLIDGVGADNAKGEYYLTDIIGLANARGFDCGVVEAEESELLGINDRIDLANAETLYQDRLRDRAMLAGATLIDPATVYLSHDTVLGQDTVVEPNVVFGPEVTVGDRVTIRAYCHLEGTVIADGAVIGPFARLRPGANLGNGVRIGNFVEVKKAVLESGAKVNHLSYVGDAHVGEGANIGAGTITCNYDGFMKHHTRIGAGAFIGSNTALVAPVHVGAGAIIGAGSVVTQDVADDSLAVARGRQAMVPGWAERFRAGHGSPDGEVKSKGKGKAKAG